MMKSILTSFTLATLAAVASGQNHTHGTMAGSIASDSVVIWTRAPFTAKVSALINTSPQLAGAVETATVDAVAGDDFTAHIRVTGLTPSTKYYYTTRIANPSNPANNVVGSWGELTTAPAANQDGVLTLLASGDVADVAQYGIFDKMRLHTADLFLMLGDMPYADGSASQADYWSRHKDTRAFAPWLQFIRKFPVEGMWDDHEVINDWDANTPANLVAWGKKAFFDHYPLPKGSTDIYRTLKWGKTAEIWFLDCRAYRGNNEAPSTPGKTMLGATQLAWLKSTLLASQATFKLVCSSVPVRYGKMFPDDWSSYVREREEILSFIATNKIRNVAILSADSHIVSVHNFRSGIREYQCGPLAQTLRPQVPAQAEVRYRASVRNFMKVKVDPTVTPAKMTLAYYDQDNNLMFEDEMLAEEPATVRVTTDLPNGGYQLDGPHFYQSRGETTFPSVHPGRYQISFQPDVRNHETPATIDVDIPAGADVVVGARWRETPGAAVMFADTFDGPLTGYTVVDETTVGGPSDWITSGGELLQASNIGGPVGANDSDRPGTMLITGNSTWKNYTVTTRFKSHSRGRVGIVFRYVDPDNYYRFVLDEERPLRRVEKKVNGVFTTLNEEPIPYLPHNFHDLRVVVQSTQIRVTFDDQTLYFANDSSIERGKVGLYTWGNRLTVFEDLIVTAGRDFSSPVNNAWTDYFEDNTVNGWTSEDHSRNSGSSVWVENAGVMMQLSNIGEVDPNDAIRQPGTVQLATATIPDDMQFLVNMVNYDDDGWGLVFRYADEDNHYRFYWNRVLRVRQLQKVVNGTWSVLWGDTDEYNPGQWYRFRILAEGSRIRVYLDGDQLVDVNDTSLTRGTVGLYSWRSNPVLYDRVIVQSPHVTVPSLVGVTKDLTTQLYGRSPRDAGLVYGVALAFSKTPSIPLSWISPGDPRFLVLAPDFLLQASIRPNPLFTNFYGNLDSNGNMNAQILWPPLPSLKGISVFASGWTGDVTQGPVRNVFPTIEIIYP